jgi:branched-chain amino acid aminotransferase
MINSNGTLVPTAESQLANNRGFLFGDGVFETVRVLDGKILFLEDHYFRLMSGMRIVRMQIPMDFTMEYLEIQILNTVQANNCAGSARARITVYRSAGGFYLPETNQVQYLIDAKPLDDTLYSISGDLYEVDLYKDFYVTQQLLSSVKTTNRLVNITASIYAHENGLQNCLILNDSKNVIEATQGNLFLLAGNKLITAPVSDGCLNGVMRKQLLALARKIDGLEVLEESISPFDLQKADELFITNVIKGIQPITKYRKKEFKMDFAQQLLVRLNSQVRLA